MTAIEVTIWKREGARSIRPRASRILVAARGLAIATVIALHVLVVLVLASVPRRFAVQEIAKTHVSIQASIVDLAQTGSAAVEQNLEPEVIDALFEPIEPTHEIVFEEGTPDLMGSLHVGPFLPPRPEGLGGAALVDALDSEAMSGLRMMRVILRVEVLATGTVGVIHVETTSGIDGVDEAAIERARSIRWSPATYGGEPTTMWVRLPVVFTNAG